MKPNLDRQGKILRLIIALVLLAYAYWQNSFIALAFALFTFFESWMSWCILYQLLGINRCPIDKHLKDNKKRDRD